MKRFEKLKHEFQLNLPATIFFFFTFILLAITRRLILRVYGIPHAGFGEEAVGALLVGKVVLIADKTLLFRIIWKSSIYFLATFLLRYIEHVFPFLREYRDHGSQPATAGGSRLAPFLENPDVARGIALPVLLPTGTDVFHA